MRSVRRAALAAALTPVLALAACTDDPATVDAAKARQIEELDVSIPLDLAGLEVVEEDISDTVADGRRPYLDAAALYSFREEDLLQATLQVGRFAEGVDYSDEEFISSIITNIGPGSRRVRMRDKQLHVTGGDRQTLSVWFDDDKMYILSTRDGFDGGRALLREALKVQA